jgi:hypothetical protein
MHLSLEHAGEIGNFARKSKKKDVFAEMLT